MPHHIVAVTKGPAAIEAGMPASCTQPKLRAKSGVTADWAASAAEADSRRKGGKALPSQKEKRGPSTARPQTAR
jgi:hypothetical protein